ncbi:MAG TPA: POTRA domain-containing protein, partial [Thermoanaerobaculia bacterium]|nr:POTRA domain-containing protein [Thermoanaerobaculia bacterium]
MRALLSPTRPGKRRTARAAQAAAASLWIALAGAVAAGQTPESTQPGPYGREISSVAYTCDGPVVSGEILALIQISAGTVLTEKATGATIRNLFATDQFADIRIAAEAEGERVAVTIHLFRAFHVKPLKFSGSFPLSREELRKALPFAEGDLFQRQVVDDGAEALSRRLQEEGFLAAQVRSEVAFDSATFDAAVVYQINAGPRAKVVSAFFDGETSPFTPAELLKHAKLKPGDGYKIARARADATRMTEWLHKNSWLKASVDLIAAQPTDDGRIMPVYRIFVGKKVLLDTRGIKASRVHREIHDLITEQGGFDEDLLLQYVDNERQALQRKGYYRAKVDYAIAEEADATRVTITVERGPHLEVEKVAFVGNDSVPAKTLQSLILTHKKGLPLLAPSHLEDRELDDDLNALRGYYQTHGWIGVTVEKPQITEGSKPTRLIVTIPIVEGPRTLVASSRIEGAEHLDAATLEKKLGLKAGDPFNPNQARLGAYNLVASYRDRGWEEVSVRDGYTLSSDKTSADVTYQVDEGLRSFFGKTIIRGNFRTKTDRIVALIAWREGDPFSETRLVETQRNLARAGVFRRVDVRPQPADPATQVRNVQIEVQEGRPLSVLYGVGYQYAPDSAVTRNDPFVVASVSYNNLFGRMMSAGLEGQIAVSGRFRLQLSYRGPYLLGKDLPFTSFLFATREPIQNIDVERLGWVNEVSHYFGTHLRVALRLEYQRIRPFNPEDLSTIELENFPRADQPIEEATTGPNFLYDRRDDVLDPHHGYYATGAVKYAFPVFKAEARYTKITGQFASFFSVGPMVLALNTRAGAIFPYGPSDIQVPIAERFFDGKNSTNRGFDSDLVGIPGQTVDYDTKAALHEGSGTGSCANDYPQLAAYDCAAGPRIVGGNGMLALNAEMRFPIAGPVKGAVFYDASQIWKNFSDVNFHFEGNDGLRQSVGFGLRVILPIGPLRADLGVPIERRTIPINVTDTTGVILIPNAGTVKEAV